MNILHHPVCAGRHGYPFHVMHFSFAVTSPVKQSENKNASFALGDQAMNDAVRNLHSTETDLYIAIEPLIMPDLIDLI